MAGGHVLGPDVVGIVEQLAELQPRVADDARIGRPTGRVLGDEIIDDPRELLLEIDRIERNAEHVGHPAGIVRVGRRATALLAPFVVPRRLPSPL